MPPKKIYRNLKYSDGVIQRRRGSKTPGGTFVPEKISKYPPIQVRLRENARAGRYRKGQKNPSAYVSQRLKGLYEKLPVIKEEEGEKDVPTHVIQGGKKKRKRKRKKTRRKSHKRKRTRRKRNRKKRTRSKSKSPKRLGFSIR